jgi:hypothetical protein
LWFLVFGTVLDDLSKSAPAHEKTFSKNKSAVWVNHRNWNTLEVPVIKQVSKMHMQVYSGLSPKKPFKKPNLGDSQMKAVFRQLCCCCVLKSAVPHHQRAKSRDFDVTRCQN